MLELKDSNPRPEYMQSADPREWEFNHFVSFKKVALVGNATSLLDHEFGEEIDSHDIVIRMNRVVNDLDKYGPSKSLGKRTDVVFAARPIEAITERKLSPHFLFWTCGQSELYSRWPEVGNTPICLEQTSRLRWKAQYGVWPTTGFLAFFRLVMGTWATVDVYGFDFFKSNSFVTGQNNSAKWHAPSLEKEAILRQIELNTYYNLPKIQLKGYTS